MIFAADTPPIAQPRQKDFKLEIRQPLGYLFFLVAFSLDCIPAKAGLNHQFFRFHTSRLFDSS
jgi:hypothetical protein